MKEIPLHGDKGVALVDDAWYPILSKHRWHLTCKGYVERSVRPGFGVMMHRVVNMTPSGLFTDHINGNKLDNRSENLRTVNNQENSWSRQRRPGVSGFRGVTKRPNGLWQASCSKGGDCGYIGVFEDPSEAARAYDKRARELFGKYAILNFSDE